LPEVADLSKVSIRTAMNFSFPKDREYYTQRAIRKEQTKIKKGLIVPG
jgi:hypothetical protein